MVKTGISTCPLPSRPMLDGLALTSLRQGTVRTSWLCTMYYSVYLHTCPSVHMPDAAARHVATAGRDGRIGGKARLAARLPLKKRGTPRVTLSGQWDCALGLNLSRVHDGSPSRPLPLRRRFMQLVRVVLSHDFAQEPKEDGRRGEAAWKGCWERDLTN